MGVHEGQARRGDVYAKSHHEDAKRKIERACVSRTGSDLINCIYEAINTSGEYQRAEYDLTAQQEMSEWARWLLIISLVATAITLLGVVYVWKTLLATQEGVIETRRIGEAQTRAYVRIALPEGLPTAVQLLGRFGIQISISNYGETPAKNCLIRSQTFVAEFPLAGDHILPGNWRDVGLGVVIHKDSSDNIAAHGANLTLQQVQSCVTFTAPIRLYMAVRVDYVDTYGHPHIEQACFSANYNDEGNRTEHANLHTIST